MVTLAVIFGTLMAQRVWKKIRAVRRTPRTSPREDLPTSSASNAGRSTEVPEGPRHLPEPQELAPPLPQDEPAQTEAGQPDPEPQDAQLPARSESSRESELATFGLSRRELEAARLALKEHEAAMPNYDRVGGN